MNVLEKEMIAMLQELKEKHGVLAVKAEFEAEGSRIDELMRLREVISYAGLPLVLKIGGVEAITDLYSALLIGVGGVVAPMAETAYAVSKFLNIIDTYIPPDNRADIHFAVNIETRTAVENVGSMLQLPNIRLLEGFTVGRGDLSGSLGMTRKDVDCDEIFDLTHSALSQAKAQGFGATVGGGITASSIPFLSRLAEDGLLDRFETRKVIFDAASLGAGEDGIVAALRFELAWLKSKRRFYHRIRNEDEVRIEALEKRLQA